jgi:alkane 1-monooxygenase
MPASLRASDLRFVLGVLLPLGALVNVWHDPLLAALGAFLIWATIAGLEAVVPALRHSPPPAGPQPLLAWLLRLYVPLQLALIASGMAVAMRGDWLDVAALAYAIGFVAGAQGITYAHDLGHSRRRADRALAWVLMASVNYPQFMVEHYRGHHLRAATHDDPATARAGESLWRFLPRALHGNLANAWRLEARRAAGKSSAWLRSPLLWATFFQAGMAGALAGAGQWKVLAFWLGQSVVAIWLLEAVNYIEHYGLTRRQQADGRPEPFGREHAWNADHLLSNSVLANLQRHSDHHMHAGKPYPALEALPGPQLPTGYGGCLLLAAIPPVWFAVMGRRLPPVEAQAPQALSVQA